MSKPKVNGEWSLVNGGIAPIRHSLFAIRLPRTLALSLLLTASALSTLACDVCQKNQPAPLRGITHGTGPQSQWDMPIVWVSAIIVGITLVLAVRMLAWPGENAPGHIKRLVLNEPGDHHGE